MAKPKIVDKKGLSARLLSIIEDRFDGVALKYAKAADITAPTLQHYTDAVSVPGGENLARLADAGEVNVAWLLKGKDKKNKLPGIQPAPGGLREIPVINGASCGSWRDFTDLDYPAGVADRFEPAPTKDQNAFYVIATGDSMTGGDIHDGDLLLIEPNAEWHDGNIVLAKSSEGCTIKLIFRHGDKIELRPMNAQHKSLFVSDDENLKVMRVSGNFRKY